MQHFRTQPSAYKPVLGLLSVYIFIYIFAVPMLVFGLVPTWGTWMGGALLVLQGGIMAWWLVLGAGRRGALAAAVIALGGWAIEYVGVQTGWPFGRYVYTEVLGWKLGAVPLPIPFAWLLVVPAALGVAAWLVRGWWRVPVAAGLALALDVLIEPTAAHVVGYWQWQSSGPYYGIPTSNFIAWGSTALVLAAATVAITRPAHLERWPLPWLPRLLFVCNFLQFALVDAAYNYGAAAFPLLGALILVLGLAWRRAMRPHATT